ncbi:MAG: MBL fold metallo-hydrolase [Oscillospiraceae bacterium]|nr:MBL fold metallo-hydrolase [Oscillospiraceae bacterium]
MSFKKSRGILTIVAFIILFGLFYGCATPIDEQTDDAIAVSSALMAAPNPSPSLSLKPLDTPQSLKVHFIDVGQGDGAFIQLPNGQNMLIDGGVSSNGVLSYLQSHDVNVIDYLVITHPHLDHIGGLPLIIDTFDVKKIYMPNATNNTQAFRNLLKSIENNGLDINEAKAGVSILSELEIHIEFVAPVRTYSNNINDNCAVVKLTYSNTLFLFMGDAESASERDITADVSADVLKVGHHGSRTSTTASFLSKVSPTYAVISVGSGNTYGHPTDEVLSRLNDAGAEIFRTDLQGTIIFSSDGTDITVNHLHKEN